MSMQVLTVENDAEAQAPQKGGGFVSYLPAITAGIVMLLQITTLVLFAYTFSQLAAMKAEVQPTVKSLTRVNFTWINEAVSYAENIVQIVKADFVPDYYALKPSLKKFPQFINETESFIEEIRKVIQPFISHLPNSTHK